MQYLAPFEIDQGAVCQGIVHFPSEPRNRTFYPDRWFQVVTRLTGARRAIPGCEVSIRTVFRNGHLAQTLFFRAPALAETALRHYLAGFLELFALADDSVILPLDRATHDALARPEVSRLCVLRPARFFAGDAWLACDFQVQEFLAELIEEAAAAGYDFLHQANLQSWSISREEERQARRNLVLLETASGVSSTLFELQRQLLTRSSGDIVLVEEYVGSDSAAGQAWLAQALTRRFAERFSGSRLESPTFDFQESRFSQFLRGGTPYADALTAAFHDAVFEPPDGVTIFSTAFHYQETGRFFAWADKLRRWFEPVLGLDKMRVKKEAKAEEEGVEKEVATVVANADDAAVPICHGPSDYVFVSYRHTDYGRVLPVMRSIVASGFPLWFDHGIPGSHEWNAVLEERLRKCRLFMLFLSQGAIDSKYVRREVLLADVLDKPILTVQLEQSTLRHGMGLLLPQFQMIDVAAPDFFHHLKAAWR